MAASITIATRFRRIQVGYHPVNGIEAIGWTTDETTPVSSSIYFPNFPETYPRNAEDHADVEAGDEEDNAYDDLAVLQEIHASTAGLQNAAGVAIVPRIVNNDFEHGDTVESLEQYGLWNPLRAGSWEAYKRRLEITSAMGVDGEFDRDADTGQAQAVLKGKWNVEGNRPEGTTFDTDLSEWAIEDISGTTDAFRLRLELQSADGITDDGLDDYTPIRALITWLESVRVGGTAVGTDATVTATFDTPRQYLFPQADGDADIRLEFTHLFERVYDSGGSNVLLYVLEFDRTSGAALDTAKLRDLFAETTVTIANTADVMEKGETGGYDTIVKAGELHLGSENVILKGVEGAVLLNSLNEHGEKTNQLLTSDRGRSVLWTDLPFITGVGYRSPEVLGRYDTIILDASETSDRRVRIPNPSNFVGYERTHRKIAFMNHNQNRLLKIEDWDGNELIDLKFGEYAEFQSNLDGNGEGGRLFGIDLPPRQMHQQGTVNNSLYTAWWFDGDNTTDYLRGIRYPGGFEQNTVDEDAFDISTGTRPGESNQGNIYDDSDQDFDFRGAFDMGMTGLMFFSWNNTFRIDTGGGGLGEPTPKLFRRRGTTVTRIAALEGRAMSGAGDRESFPLSHIFNVQKDDRYFMMIGHTTVSSIGNIDWQELTWFAVLLPYINVAWTG